MPGDWKMELYWRLPVPLHEVGLSLYARRLDRLYYGREFRRACQSIRESRWDSQADCLQWQLEQLQTILASAIAHVDYYKHTLKGLKADDIRSLDTLRDLPILDRQAVRQKERLFVDERLNTGRLFR